MRPTDLRGILGYTTHFRGKVFVLSVDSQVIDDENFKNLLLDISVLRSLNVKIVLVHGATTRLKSLGERMQVKLTDTEGTGITDEATLEVAILGLFQIGQKILEGLSELDLQGAIPNAVIAHPSGIVDGIDNGCAGRVERIDGELILGMVESGVIPVVPAIGYDGDGKSFRVHSDHVAVELAREIKAAKLIFVGNTAGVQEAGSLSAQFSVEEADEFIKHHSGKESAYVVSKLRSALKACRGGVSRAHLIDGLRDDALLSELFSNEGVGTMVYANEYEAIRPAEKRDVGAIRRLVRQSEVEQEVVYRSESDIEELIEDFLVFEIDGNVVGCVAIHASTEEAGLGELACLIVSEAHANQGIGKKLVSFGETQAKQKGISTLYVLSTRAFNFFAQKGGYAEADADLLPPERKVRYTESGRNSRILLKSLG
ncbi:MAG: amino-acid N-acetyltransferase [Verrucomicrobiota bacterium]